MSDEVKFQMYITGFKPEIQVQLVKARPSDISKAFALASICEGQGEIFEGNKQIVAWQELRSTYIPLPKRQTWPEQSTTKAMAFIRNRLTSTELKARREKNMCYNCEEKWVKGHRCKGSFFACLRRATC